MKATDLEISELIQVNDGEISLQGRRMVLHSMNAFGRLRKDLLATLGWSQTRRLFTRFGYFWGQIDADTLTNNMQWPAEGERFRAMARMISLTGLANASILKSEIRENPRSFHMECIWDKSGEVSEFLEEIGQTDQQVCWRLIGYASGFASYCFGEPVYFIEHNCRAKGDVLCTAIGRDVRSWGDEITPYLPFFHSDDISGRVEQLGKQMRSKSKKLPLTRSRSEQRNENTPFFSEGRSDAFYHVLDLADRVSQFDSSILITGETGTGKEVLARRIHEGSHRGKRPFVAMDCGAIPETLLEAELFGYRTGSFTGAVRDRVGLFEEAGGSTVFLDEIGDIGLAVQAKLLRVIQEREITRIGENRSRPVDVRIVAATSKDLDEEVAQGRFRSDLLYRLRVIEIHIPPLRERPEDILPLSRHIVIKLARRLKLPRLRLDASCIDYLQAYDWPGNVREMENALERAAVLSQDGVIRPDCLPPHVVDEAAGKVRQRGRVNRTLEEIEYEHIMAVLRSNGNNRTRTAEILGISPVTLWRRLKQA
jgi:two-component system response regulator HydG